LFRFAYRLTSSPAAAEDLVLPRLVSRRIRSAKRLPAHLSLRRRAKSFAKAVPRSGPRRFLDDVDAPGGDAGPLESLLARESADGVRLAIEGLPVLQREVLILAEYEEMPLEEIARIVDADLSAVKSRLHRARERLKKLLVRYEV
jgi:RNA polymerase sigma factor (sigma-70 family)